MKGPLPTELISRRSTSSFSVNKASNSMSYSRASTETGPFIVRQPTVAVHNEIPLTDPLKSRESTRLPIPSKSLDTRLHQLDELDLNSMTVATHSNKSIVNNNE